MNLDTAEIERRVNDSYELPNNVLKAVPAPVVTVRTYTYQHGPYIQDCIEGVLAQKTTFPFEYIIGEDCSTDGTREIVFEYARRYPDIIRVVTADYNVGGNANVIRCKRRTRGKYIALCDGDDYWTDPLKLQKQVDFLEMHPDYGVVYTNYDRLWVAKNKIVRGYLRFLGEESDYRDSEQLFDDLLEKTWIWPSTAVMRASLYDAVQKDLDEIRGHFLTGDLPLWLEMSRLTKFHYIDEVSTVYRVLPESMTHSMSAEKQLRLNLSSAELRVYFAKKYRTEIPLALRRRYNRALILYKTCEPDFVERYPLIQPDIIERFFYKIHHPSIRFWVKLWWLLLVTHDNGLNHLRRWFLNKVKLKWSMSSLP